MLSTKSSASCVVIFSVDGGGDVAATAMVAKADSWGPMKLLGSKKCGGVSEEASCWFLSFLLRASSTFFGRRPVVLFGFPFFLFFVGGACWVVVTAYDVLRCEYLIFTSQCTLPES